MEPASKALWVLFLLVAFTQDSLSFSNNTSTPGLQKASTTITTITTVTAALTVSNTTHSTANVTSKAASSSLPQSTSATSSTTKTNDSTTTNGGTTISPTGSKTLLTSQSAESVNGSTQAGQLSPEPAYSTKAGLVVVICLFVFVLVFGVVVVLIKCCRRKEPAFKKLDEVPMRKVAEDSPFARYPPK